MIAAVPDDPCPGQASNAAIAAASSANKHFGHEDATVSPEGQCPRDRINAKTSKRSIRSPHLGRRGRRSILPTRTEYHRKGAA